LSIWFYLEQFHQTFQKWVLWKAMVLKSTGEPIILVPIQKWWICWCWGLVDD
jgi:hypothetical protein